MVPDDLAGLRKLYLGFISSRVILTANNLRIFDNLEKASSATEISALSSVNMLVGTEKGRCYSPREIKRWLAETGYKNIGIKYQPETVLIMGERKE